MKIRGMAALVSLAAVALAGCGSASAVEKDQSYKSVMDLRDAYLDADINDDECDEEVTQDFLELGAQSINCGMYTNVLVSTNAAGLKHFVDQNVEFNDGREAALVGPNWVVNGPDLEMERLQKVIGGELK